MAVFWLVAPCSLVEVYHALMMQAASTSETVVNVYQTTWRYNPEDSHLHTHHRENLKSYVVNFVFRDTQRHILPESKLQLYIQLGPRKPNK
jgi:hypothetical protein